MDVFFPSGGNPRFRFCYSDEIHSNIEVPQMISVAKTVLPATLRQFDPLRH
jgi:hypothetical protein